MNDILKSRNRNIAALLAITLMIAVSLLALNPWEAEENGGPAPDFDATDTEGVSFSLYNLTGQALIIHITNIEEPFCMECEEEMRAQTEELEELAIQRPDIEVVTVNIRYKPESEPGKELAQRYWEVNITWHWVDDLDPYPVSGKYLKYWNLEGGAANPTLLLLDGQKNVAGIYHVYQMGKGEVDGIQTADMLAQKIERLEEGTWEGLEGEIASQRTGFAAMFVLGIITTLSPCSIMLLIAMLSYVMTATRRETGGQTAGVSGPENGKENQSNIKDGLIIGTGFTMGMALVFFIIGLFISFIGAFVRASPFFYLAAGVLMVALGIHNIKSLGEVLEPLRNLIGKVMEKDTVDPGNASGKTLTERFTEMTAGIAGHSIGLGAFLLGIFFAIGWAPCAISLVLPVIVWMASQNLSVLIGALMLFTFGLGHGILVIPLAMASRSARGRIGQKYVRIGKWITKVFGVAVIIIGAMFVARYFGFNIW